MLGLADRYAAKMMNKKNTFTFPFYIYLLVDHLFQKSV